MTTYTLANGQYTPSTIQAQIGQKYHLGLSNGVQAYGYLLEPDNSKNGGFRQRSDTAGRDALVQTASPNLIDRLIAFYPRVTDGDFSGGGYQEVWLQPNRYFDSDLDPRVPGFLQLRQQWTRSSKAGLTVGANFQVVAFNGDFWFSFGEASSNVYSANAGTTGTPGGGAVISLDTDGSFLYAGTATGLWRSSNGASWSQIVSSINGTATQWWVVNQGSNGYFAYYQSGPNLLYKVDLTVGAPIPLGNQTQIGVGSNAINIIDLVEYQTSIAILTTDVRGPGFDIWYFDGSNLTRIIRVEGYTAQGMCVALGELYIGAFAVGQTTSPILAHVSSGSYDIVARPGSPFPAASQTCLQPRASSQYVYWPVINPSIKGIASAPGVILQYDVLTQAVTHLPNQDTTDFTATGGTLRAVAALGDNLCACYANGTTGVAQYQQAAFATIKYQSSGWLVSSRIDFATPGISKRFRRIEISHAPLATGERIDIEAFVDLDPLVFTTALAPTATAFNATAGTSSTALSVGVDTVGRTLYFALKLTAGTSNNTSPRVSYVSIEIGGTWAWEVSLACTSKRQLLDGQNDDSQGVNGKDLAYLLLLAYEQGANLTLYHRNGQSYTVAIESFTAWNPSPMLVSQPQQIRDEEYVVNAVLRQVA